MYFDDEFVKSLPDDWNYAVLIINDRFKYLLNTLTIDKQYSATEQLWSFLKVLREKNKFKLKVPALIGNAQVDINNIREFIIRLSKQAKAVIKRQNKDAELSHYENVYRIALDNAFHFEFSEGDVERIQKLTNELRDLISKSTEIEEKHKQRLLRKLEKFQSEIHKKVSTLDSAWGFLIESSLKIGQMGENVKPMVDRIRELASIIGPTSTRAYDLPSNLPIKLLGQSEEEKSEETDK